MTNLEEKIKLWDDNANFTSNKYVLMRKLHEEIGELCVEMLTCRNPPVIRELERGVGIEVGDVAIVLHLLSALYTGKGINHWMAVAHEKNLARRKI